MDEVTMMAAPAGDGISVAQDAIERWRAAVGLPVNGTLAVRDPVLHARLLREECQETVDALIAGDAVEVADGLADMIVVAMGCAADCGFDLGPVMVEVMRSNWTKYPPTYDETGKLMKGPNYQPPDIARVLGLSDRKQLDAAEHGATREGDKR